MTSRENQKLTTVNGVRRQPFVRTTLLKLFTAVSRKIDGRPARDNPESEYG